jgi:lipoprotein signal peptidase
VGVAVSDIPRHPFVVLAFNAGAWFASREDIETGLKLLLLLLSIVLTILSIIHMTYRVRSERRKRNNEAITRTDSD